MLKHTRQIRKIMKQNGREMIFTNLYDTCRTVKCYKPHDDVTVKLLYAELANYKAANKLEGTMTIKETKRSRHGLATRWPAIIVRFPLD